MAPSPVSPQPIGFAKDVASPVRMYDYYLGGKDNFQADRDAAEQVIAAIPNLRLIAQANRAFLNRVVGYLAAECGIRQFLDVGSGLPTQRNVHQVAQDCAPEARVVYVDNDPVVLAHGRALLADDRTGIITADMREPEKILTHPDLVRQIDLNRPVALLLIAVLHFVRDDEAYDIVKALCSAMPAGSYLAISHGELTEEMRRGAEVYEERAKVPGVPRTREQIARFFDGLELVDPGLVPVTQWQPTGTPDQEVDLPHLGGVARIGSVPAAPAA